MAVTLDKLDAAQAAFEAAPSNATCAEYLSVAHEMHEHGALDEGPFMDVLFEIEQYLWKGGSVVV